MPVLLALLLLAAPHFWDARAPSEWTDAEVNALLSDSPWVQGVTPVPQVQVFLATAKPVEQAEAETLRRGMPNPFTGGRALKAPDLDYLDYMKDHRDEFFVLAIPYGDISGFRKADEEKRMEDQTVMRLGKRVVKMSGCFPPTPEHSVLRILFPRVVTEADKTAAFDLYLPGITHPSRMVEFRVKDLIYHGKLEM